MRKQFSGTVLLAAAVAGISAAAAGAQPGLAASSGTWRTQLATDPTGAVGLAASTLLWLLIGLVAIGVLATVLGRLPGVTGACFDALSRRLLPATIRRVLHLMIGVTVGVTALAPSGAWAASVASVRPIVSVTMTLPAASLPNPLPTLGEPGGPVTMPSATAPLPTVAPPPHATPTPTGTPGTPAPVQVAPTTGNRAHQPAMDTTMAGAFGAASTPTLAVSPGDNLWVLAARTLAQRDGGRAVSNATIAAEWPRWWAANRAAIGADPNLLTPGEQLTPPA